MLTTSSLSNQTGTWLVFADNTGISEKLVTLLKIQQQQCHLVIRNTVTDNPEAFQTLIHQQEDIAGVVYLWSLDSVEDWTECKSYLYLIQALIQHSANPSLWLVTRNAQPVDNYQLTSEINNSCLWGMQKAIALEHIELKCVGIDLDRNSTDNEAESIFQEICTGEIEQVAYRRHQRYVSRLIQANLTESKLNQQLQISHAGNLDSLQWQPITRSQPQDREIEIEVKATGLNFRDVMIALNLYPDETKFLGLECAGVVTAVGTAGDFQLGDEVVTISANSFSQYLTVDSRLAIHKPECSFAQAATIPVTFLTAYYTLSYVAQIKPGEKVLIHAAAGGVGLAAIQIAQRLGAEVFATASTPKWQLLKSMGVTKIMNSRSLSFAEEVMSATHGKGVDVVLNSLSGEFIPKSISVLNDRGHFIEIGKQGIWSANDVAQVKPGINYSVVDLWQITQEQPELIRQMLAKLRSQFITRELKPLPHKVFTRDNTIAAFRYMQQGKHQGKIIITQDNRSDKREGKQPFAPSTNCTYLITGGMGAIGLEVAQWLITKGVTNLVLLGRSGVKPELQDKLQKIQENTQVNLIKADVADTNQLAQALLQIESTLPPLRGVIHCAGVIDDRSISNQDWTSFSEVLAPKVQGAWNLHSLTQKYDLESFILFSSASSLLGSAGQANYCAANAFLDTLAHGRRSLGLPAIAINWGAWNNTGLTTNTQITASLQQKGIGSIKPIQGIEILEQLLLDSPVQIGVIPLNWQVWQENNFATPFHSNFVVSSNSLSNNTDIKQQLLTIDITQRRDLLINNISEQVGNILGIKDLNKIDFNLGFSELGLDSLGSVELRNKLQSGYALKLSQTVIFDYSNINSLADYLLTVIWENELIKENIDFKDNILTQVETMTDAEAEALLLEELKDFDF